MHIVVVGAGLTGAVIAEHYASQGHHVTVYEKRNHIAGNCYDYTDSKTGVLVSKYGPHFFHTNNEQIWQYVQRFATWIPYEIRVKSRVVLEDGRERMVSVPVNISTVNDLYGSNITSTHEMADFLSRTQIVCDSPKNSEDVGLARVGERMYNLMFKGYTQKQWDKDPKDLDASVLSRIPVRYDNDDRYFTDKYQGIPLQGYTKFIETMLNHPNISIVLETNFDRSNGGSYDKIYFTGAIDQYFDRSGLGKLEYRSLHFDVHSTDRTYQDYPVVNEPSWSVPYTRTTEYKHLPYEQNKATSGTVYVHEYSTSDGDPYYPVPTPRNQELYHQYKLLADRETREKDVYFVGRLASYKYFNMDEAIAAAFGVLAQK